MTDHLITPEDLIREGESLIKIGQRLVAYGESLKGTDGRGRSAKKAKRTPLYKDPVFMAQALERIFKDQDRFLAKQAKKAQLEAARNEVIRKTGR